MKKYHLLTSFLIFVLSYTACTSTKSNLTNSPLIFSEIHVGNNLYDWAIEIANISEEDIDISTYHLSIYAGNSTTEKTDIFLPSYSLGLQETYVISHSSADASLLALSNLTSSSLTFDGTWPIALYRGKTLSDVLGIIGYQSNYAVDLDLVRKSNFMYGRREYNAYDWIRYSNDYLNNLGTINNDFTPEEFLQGPHLTAEDFALPLTEDGVVGAGGAVNVSVTYYGDGDTTTVAFPTSATTTGYIASRESVRYLAINCPEIQHGDYIDAEPWGYAAKDYNNDLLGSATAVAVSTSKNYTIRDTYGRLLGYIWIAFNANPQPEDYFNMSYLMVKEGYASLRFLGGDQANDQMYYRDVTYTNFIRNAEILATDLGLKIHGEIDPDFEY